MEEIAVFAGCRSDYGLLEPLIEKLKCDVITTDAIDVPNSLKIEMNVMADSLSGTSKAMGLGLIQLSEIVKNYHKIVILGDRFEALCCAIAAYNEGVKIFHIEGSDTTLGSLDEGYRKCIRNLATYHLDVEEYGSLGCVFPDIPPCDTNGYYVQILHPHKGDSQKEKEILALARQRFLAGEYGACFFFSSNLDSGGRRLGEIYCNSLPRKDYLRILKYSKFIIGNSSSGIIEAPSLGVPTVNIGDRQKGRLRASSIIDCDGKSVEGIREAIQKALSIDMSKVVNPYYKPDTLERVYTFIREAD